MSRRRPQSQQRPCQRRNPSLPETLDRVNLHAAGIDVSAGMHHVAVPVGSSPDGEDVKECGAFTEDLHGIAEWLKRCQVDTVAMESTGVYWIPLFEVLESAGLEVLLVDPRQMKSVPGRKTDILDCQWIQTLHTFGLLRGAFRPPEHVCVLRSYVRQRAMLVTYASHHIQHIQKALEQMNIKLSRVITELTGVTGMKIIRDILAGERDPHHLARHRDRRCKADEATVAKSLEGTWREEHVFALRQAVGLYDTYQQHITACDDAMEALLEDWKASEPSHELQAKAHGKRRRNASHFDLHHALHRVSGVDLTRIEGIDASTALKVLGEIGIDVSRFPSVKHFASWTSLCPGNNITGGKRRSGRTRPSANRVATALRVAARSLWNSKSAMGAFMRRKAAHKGMPKAITATAHRMARMVYFMLKYGTEYVVRSQEHYEAEHRERQVRNLLRRAKDLGFSLVAQTKEQELVTA
jgi:transposase